MKSFKEEKRKLIDSGLIGLYLAVILLVNMVHHSTFFPDDPIPVLDRITWSLFILVLAIYISLFVFRLNNNHPKLLNPVRQLKTKIINSLDTPVFEIVFEALEAIVLLLMLFFGFGVTFFMLGH